MKQKQERGGMCEIAYLRSGILIEGLYSYPHKMYYLYNPRRKDLLWEHIDRPEIKDLYSNYKPHYLSTSQSHIMGLTTLY